MLQPQSTESISALSLQVPSVYKFPQSTSASEKGMCTQVAHGLRRQILLLQAGVQRETYGA